MSPLRLNGVAIDDTFAEAFGMKATRLVDGKVTVTGQPVELPAELQHNLLRI